MKKLKIFLIIALIFPLLIKAETIQTSGDDANINVVVGEVEGSSEAVSDIEIKWKQMVFTYNVVESYTWDSETHKYVKVSNNSYWTNNGNSITVVNKTANQVSISPKYVSKLNDIIGKFNTEKFNLAAYANKTFQFELSGELEKEYHNAKAGYITIEIE